MKTILHPANERGHANHGWLNSYHSFSFAGFYDAQKIHFGALRVLNDDTVKGGMGFSKHPHDNMEIVSIPLAGDLKHEDSTGRKAIIKQGDVQIMSAGSGIVHSEMNANHHLPVEFLQIWIFPKEKNIAPQYHQKTFDVTQRVNTWQTVVAPNNANAVWINQDAWLSLTTLQKEATINYQLNKNGNGMYLFVIDGSVTINNTTLQKRDAIGIWEADAITILANNHSELLLIEVPMQAPLN
jgi:redox-sensitive bicupin YhaK (pirin superfamily)